LYPLSLPDPLSIYGTAGVKLERQHAAACDLVIFFDVLRRDEIVDRQGDRVADRANLVVIPLPRRLEETLHPVLPSLRQHAAPALVVQAAEVALPEVGLVARDHETRGIVDLSAPKLDAAVAAVELEVEVQNEILERLLEDEES